jgi:CRP/FNR family transcriptional regulator, cyclic AMP receptor protein
MSSVGELNTKGAQELSSAAVVGAPQPLPFTRDLTRSAIIPASLRTLPPAMVSGPDEIKRPQYYANGSVIFRQGEHSTGVFTVKRGTVKISTTSSKGRAVILRIARAGEMLGLASVFSGEPYIATAEALEDTEVAYFEREQFLDFLMHSPEAAIMVAQQACSNYKGALRQITLLGLCRSATERLAQFLLNWAGGKAYRDSSPVWLGLTHEEISQIAGTTRETVTRTLTDFRRRGWASLASSNLVIRDRAALEKLAA